jgi:SAM-dependent methyltransferase
MKSATRGFGLLEGFLSRHRAARADSMIPGGLRQGRILDIGCGSYPVFLMRTEFEEKFGLEKTIVHGTLAELETAGITLVAHDFESGYALPFGEDYFSVVTMLAVIEHIEPQCVRPLLSEILRVMAPGGMLVMTTPAAWTDGLLRLMAAMRLVSSVEIEEHKDTYTPGKLVRLLGEAGFKRNGIRTGYFEIFMNICATAEKQNVGGS